MTRLLLLAALLAVLALASAIDSPFDISPSDVLQQSDCINGCSNHGTCVKSASGSSTCLCEHLYLAVDCSIESVMMPHCWFEHPHRVCSYWVLQGDYIYMRVVGPYAEGWVGVMWNATDGMANGQSTVMALQGAYYPTIFEGYNEKKGRPQNLTVQSIAQVNVTGGATKHGQLDISFHRLLAPGPDHFAIPSQLGVLTNMSVAFSGVFYEFHHGNATETFVDIAAAAHNMSSWDTVDMPQGEESFVDAIRHAIKRLL